LREGKGKSHFLTKVFKCHFKPKTRYIYRTFS